MPTTIPAVVIGLSSAAREIPKSMMRGPSAARITLLGLRSRWTSPQAWIAASPSARPAPSWRTRSTLNAPPSATACCSDGPGMNAVTIHGASAEGSASTTEAV